MKKIEQVSGPRERETLEGAATNVFFLHTVGLWVALGSGLGGGARVVAVNVILFIPDATLATGILAVNVLGSFAIGLVASLTTPGGRWRLGPAARQGLMAGFCGGFTTFSFFSLETLALLQQDRWAAAAIYVALTIALSLAAAWLGYEAGRRTRTNAQSQSSVASLADSAHRNGP